MTIKEFWESVYIKQSENNSNYLLVFKKQIINSGSAMRMKMEIDELLKRLIESGEVIL